MKYFRSKNGEIPFPLFFPDATRAVVKSLDFADLEGTHTPGVLVNTFHLWQGLNRNVLKKFGDIAGFMNWKGGVISDSGGFQVMSLIKSGEMKGKIMDEGIILYPGKNKKKIIFSPEESIRFQMELGSDMVVVLDDFTDPKSNYEEAKDTVERTLSWAKRSKDEFEKICRKKGLTEKERPYLLGVVQGGEFMDLRRFCTEELVKIGFDGLGWGGWPFVDGKINFKSAQVIKKYSPDDYLLYGLGIGKPEDIVKAVSLGFSIFDCVLPTRDARHGRLYVFNAKSIDEIKIDLSKADSYFGKKKFYSYFSPNKDKYLSDDSKMSEYCDCLLCKKYSKGYLAHLYKIGDSTALRLGSIHNLRFISILMDKLRK